MNKMFRGAALLLLAASAFGLARPAAAQAPALFPPNTRDRRRRYPGWRTAAAARRASKASGAVRPRNDRSNRTLRSGQGGSGPVGAAGRAVRLVGDADSAATVVPNATAKTPAPSPEHTPAASYPASMTPALRSAYSPARAAGASRGAREAHRGARIIKPHAAERPGPPPARRHAPNLTPMPAVASAAPVAQPTPAPKKVWPAAFETRDETKPYETMGVVYFDKPSLPVKQAAAIKPAPVVVAAAVKPAPSSPSRAVPRRRGLRRPARRDRGLVRRRRHDGRDDEAAGRRHAGEGARPRRRRGTKSDGQDPATTGNGRADGASGGGSETVRPGLRTPARRKPRRRAGGRREPAARPTPCAVRPNCEGGCAYLPPPSRRTARARPGFREVVQWRRHVHHRFLCGRLFRRLPQTLADKFQPFAPLSDPFPFADDLQLRLAGRLFQFGVAALDAEDLVLQALAVFFQFKRELSQRGRAQTVFRRLGFHPAAQFLRLGRPLPGFFLRGGQGRIALGEGAVKSLVFLTRRIRVRRPAQLPHLAHQPHHFRPLLPQ